MKTTAKIILASLTLAFASCQKEELFEPVQKVYEVDEPVKATAKLEPKLSLQINQRTHNAPYEELREHKTVQFNGNFWSVTKTFISGNSFSKLWSSPDGVTWRFIRYSPFPANVHVYEMVVHNGQIFAITTSNTTGTLHVYSSTDGNSWSLTSSNVPFSILTSSGAIVFNDKIFVFAWTDYSDSGQDVYSSPDGISWTLENPNAFPVRLAGTSIVFNDSLYYIGGLNNGSEQQRTIFKSTNGRDWSLVPGATPSFIRPTENFPAKSHHSAVVHDNKVWVTGGGTTPADAATGKDIWYTGDMENWIKYAGYVSLKPLRNATLLSHGNKMLLLGGTYYEISKGSSISVASTYVWSIKPKREGWIPVDVPKPTLPPL